VPTKEEIRAILKQLEGRSAHELESETLEFKRWEPNLKQLHRLLREEAVCLANTRGGAIVLGVNERARTRKEAIQGVGQYDIPSLRRAIYDGTDPHILVDIEEIIEPEGTLLLVHIPRGLPPHTTTDGVSRIRVGSECKPLTGRMLAQLLAAGGQRDITAEVIPDACLDDLDPKDIAELRRIIEQDAENKNLASLQVNELLSSLGLVSGENPVFACLLLLGKAEVIRRTIPQHEVTFIRYIGPTRYDQRKDLRGSLLSVLKDMENLISINNRIKTIQENGFRQLELPDLSWEVSREAVLNAMTHRDYFIRQNIQVALRRDRLEVISPGGFIGGVTPENILRHPPVHRNELLARVFQTIGLVNRVGLGVDRIYERLLELGKDLPRYSADESHVQLTIPLESHTEFALFVLEERRRGKVLLLDDLILLSQLVHVSSLDRWSAASALQLSKDEAAERLVKLREAGYLVVRGRGRSATYDLNRGLADRLTGRGRVDAEMLLDREGVKLRILSLLRERGRLTNSDIRRFSAMDRIQVYRLVKELEADGKIRFKGRGRAAFIELAENK
jgi:ATP-dependent DNA helicase RecG